MKYAFRLGALLVIGAMAGYGLSETQAAGMGSIRGFVKDGQGNPLIGAAVLVLADLNEQSPDKLIKRASTDSEGKFTAQGLAPGRYRLKAEAAGFNPVEIAAEVRPNKATIFDSISLRKVGTLAEEASRNPSPKLSARRSRGSIFNIDEEKKGPVAGADEADTVALTDRSPEVHGYVNAYGQSSVSDSEQRGSLAGANFAVSQQLGQDSNLIVNGQVGYGDGAPQRLQAVTTAHAGDRHKLSVALGYGRFTFSRRDNPKLGQFSLSATDTWQVAGPVMVVYGLEVARFTEGGSGTSILPRFGISTDVDPRTRLTASLQPGSSLDEHSRVSLESGEIVFSEPKPLVRSADGDPVADRSYRLQFGGERILSENSSLEMMAFLDTISGHGVGLLAIPLANGPDDRPGSLRRNEELRGKTRGLRVVYRRRVNDVIEGAVGYSFGQGQRLDAQGLTEPAELFTHGLFHVFTAKVDANFADTGTRVSTVLRLAPGQAVFAIDPFQGQLTTFDPNLSIYLTQNLPSLDILPGQWQAMVDVRNLLDQQAGVSDDRQELVASRYHRLIRVGVSMRF